MTKTSILRKPIAVLIAVAMVFAAMPLLGAMGVETAKSQTDVYAADGDGSSITFNYEVNGEIVKTYVTSYSALDTAITQSDGSSFKYLAWDGSAYKVYGISAQADGILLTDIATYLNTQWSGASLTSGTVVLKSADGSIKEYSSNDVFATRPDFITNATSTEIPATATFAGAAKTPAILSLSAKSAEILTTSGAVESSNIATAVDGLSLLANLDARPTQLESYGYSSFDGRYKALGDIPQNITEITFTYNNTFNVYEQIGSETRTVKKSYTDAQFASLGTSGKIGFLHYGDNKWTVSGTDKYVKIQDLIDDTGLVFNAGDALLIRSSDLFSYRPTYETIQSEKYFFGGITPDSVTTANSTEVGAVIAVFDSADNSSVHHGSTDLTGGTAFTTLQNLAFSANGQTRTKRFFIGLSAANATAKIAAGNRFPNSVTEVTVIKDKPDVITEASVTGVNASYPKSTDSAITPIKPEVTVTLDGEALVKDRDYTVTYGTNKESAGAVVVTGKGSVTGTVAKTFAIDDGSKKAAEDLAAAKDSALKDALAKLDTANQAIFKALTPSKGSFKVTAGKKKATVKWKKISTATSGYQIQLATNKKFTSGKKTVKVTKAATVKSTVKSLKKGKTYYFRVRGAAKIGTKTVYTKWSAVKQVKVK